MNDFEKLMIKHAAYHLVSSGMVKESIDLQSILQQLWSKIRGMLGMQPNQSFGDYAGQMTHLRDLSDRLNTRTIQYYDEVPPPSVDEPGNPFLA